MKYDPNLLSREEQDIVLVLSTYSTCEESNKIYADDLVRLWRDGGELDEEVKGVNAGGEGDGMKWLYYYFII